MYFVSQVCPDKFDLHGQIFPNKYARTNVPRQICLLRRNHFLVNFLHPLYQNLAIHFFTFNIWLICCKFVLFFLYTPMKSFKFSICLELIRFTLIIFYTPLDLRLKFSRRSSNQKVFILFIDVYKIVYTHIFIVSVHMYIVRGRGNNM